MIAEKMRLREFGPLWLGEEFDSQEPWQFVFQWIAKPQNMPKRAVPSLCEALDAPWTAAYLDSRILNGKDFSSFYFLHKNRNIINGEMRKEAQFVDGKPSKDLVNELKKRGYKVVKRKRRRLREFFRSFMQRPSPGSIEVNVEVL